MITVIKEHAILTSTNQPIMLRSFCAKLWIMALYAPRRTMKEQMTKLAEERFAPTSLPTHESSVEGGGGWLAQLVSTLSNPLFIALPLFLIVALSTAPDVLHALLWWVVTALGISIAPFLFVRRGVQRGHYTDQHVSVREQRFVPLLFGVGCFLLAFVLLFFLHVATPLLATVMAALVALAIATVITRYWKISLHLVGMAGAVTVLVLRFGPLFLLVSPLVLLVAWARWKVHAHTPLQALAGTLLAVSVTVAIFWLFGLH